MQNIELSLLESGQFFPLSASRGSPIATRYFDSGKVYPVSLIYEQEISLLSVDSLEILDSNIFLGSLVALASIVDSSFIFSSDIETSNEVLLSSFDSMEMYPVSTYLNAIILGVIDSQEFFTADLQVSFSLSLLESLEIYPVTLSSVGNIQLSVIDSEEIFPSLVEVEDVEIALHFIESASFVFPISTLQDRDFPLRFKKSDGLGGEITNSLISPAQRYYTKPSLFDLDNKNHFFYSPVSSSVLDRYIPSNEALFSRVFYRSIYISNDSDFSTKTNIDFWVDGGSVYRIDDDRVLENRFLLEDEEAQAGLQLPNRESILYDGKSRTSLFGNVRVDYFVSDEPVLNRFNENGVGVGIDLRRFNFNPGNNKVRLPDLLPGGSIGIYLRITIQFKPDFPIKKDYSFFHMSYNNDVTEYRETYPGPSRINTVQTSLMLPSIFMTVSTNYRTLERYLNEDVEKIYEKYPPYFISLEDLGNE